MQPRSLIRLARFSEDWCHEAIAGLGARVNCLGSAETIALPNLLHHQVSYRTALAAFDKPKV